MPLATAIACGLVAALFYLSVLTGSLGALILFNLVQLPLFIAGLSLGAKAALIAGATAAVATAATGGWIAGLIMLVTGALPVICLVLLALRRSGKGWARPEGLVLALVAFGAVPIVLATLLLAGEPGGLRSAVHELLTGQLAGLLASAAPELHDATQRSESVAALVTPFFPAAATGSWIVMMAINGVLAQGALARFGFNRRPAPDIAAVTLPRWFAAVPAGAAALAFAAPESWGYCGLNLLPVAGFAYVVGGLAVLHAAVRRYAGRAFLLMPFYATMLLGWPVLVLAACGMIDQWFGLRQRFAAGPRQGEE